MTAFFRVVRVAEALAGFRPARRTAAERVPLERAGGRVAAAAVRAPQPLPGFARSSVDGYAVHAADTFAASEAQPAYLELAGAVPMGAPAGTAVRPGAAVAVPTGAMLPEGADAVVMIEHTAQALPGTVEVLRPVAPGDGVVRPDEDVAAGREVVGAGRRLGPDDLALLAGLGVVEIDVYAQPRVAIVATGDEVVPPATTRLAPGQVRDAITIAVATLVEQAGGAPDPRGIVPDEPDALAAALAAARDDADLVVVSAGSSVGARDTTAAVVDGLGEPGIWCHGLALRPGKPTLLAECGGVPLIGLPGNPLSALIVFRLLGIPLVRLVGGEEGAPAPSRVEAALLDAVPSAAGRLDVVPVVLEPSGARPLLGRSSQLSLLARADGLVQIPEEATGLPVGTIVQVERLR